ncbi:MAG: metal ABC transporter permease, partial [Roseivirga sp.]|nr:metal ABC transporter permease [Roseivirga sp.]
PIDLWIGDDGTIFGPRALYVAAMTLIVNIAFIRIGFKQLHLTTFDPAFAATIGISVSLWNYLLMGAVSMTTVAAFDSVGAILVVALLVGPAAIAYLLTDRFQTMMIITVFVAIISSTLGYYLAVLVDGSIAGAIVTIIGILFGITFLFSPSNGVLMKKRLQRKEAQRLKTEAPLS